MAETTLTVDSLRRSPLVQIIVLGILLLVLQIPVLMISNLIWERENTRAAAVAEIGQGVGGAQEIAGPFLAVPYRIVTTHTDAEGVERAVEYETMATFLPRQLAVDANLTAEKRYRGIFEAPVYHANASISGSFERPDIAPLIASNVERTVVHWDRAEIVFEITEVRAIQTEAALDWGGRSIPFEPGTGLRISERAGIHAPLPPFEGDSIDFSVDLALTGSQALRFAPLGQQTSVRVKADWPDPSFQGPWPPTERSVGADSFEAAWEIPYLGRNYPQSWTGKDNPKTAEVLGSLFGFDLLTPTDGYRRTERSLKYEALFLGLTFLTIWLFEVLAGARIHIIQYGLIGAALCLFYLLELSLSEHLGFGTAYLLASAAVVALVAFYGHSVMPRKSQALTVTATTAGLYAYLYVLIQLQDYALLAGSLGLLAILAAIMFATRKVNWFSPRMETTPQG